MGEAVGYETQTMYTQSIAAFRFPPSAFFYALLETTFPRFAYLHRQLLILKERFPKYDNLPFRHKFLVLFFAFLVSLSAIVNARRPTRTNTESSRRLITFAAAWSISTLAIDLRFDWDKEQAFGSTVVTLAPFKDTNKFIWTRRR